MRMIWTALKQAGGDFWDELLLLIIFNAIWLLGSLLLLPWPYLTFGLFYTAYQVGQGKAIKFRTFFVGPAPIWKQAYLWGGLNAFLLFVVWFNIRFYGSFNTQWSTVLQILLGAFAIFWVMLQLVALPMYPRLNEPGLKLALRNGVVAMGQFPLATLVLLLIVAAMVVVGSLFPLFAFMGAGSLTAVLANRIVGAIVERSLTRGA
jgi:hypothetical protein